MSFLLNNVSVRFFIFIMVLSGISCHRNGKKFIAPVDQAIRLDSTEIGISTIVSDLNVPWEIAWGPDGEIWLTEQKGVVSEVDPHTGEKTILLDIEDEVYTGTTPGLLGMALYDRHNDHFAFLTYTHKDKHAEIVLRLARYRFINDTLTDPLILREIPGGKAHNGSRVAVSPDGKIFWATGDLADNNNAQDRNSPNGKVLRLNPDGSVPKDNPFPGNPVWAMGFRAPEGLAFTPGGALFLSMHGPASDDEINLIKKGGNYGWPEVNGYADLPAERKYSDSIHIIPPVKAWTPTIAPAGIDYYHSDKIPEWNNSVLLTTLKGSSLRILKLNHQQDAIVSEKIFFKNKFGRLRDVCVSPDGDIYLATSNKDWKKSGKGVPDDDRIIRIAKINSQSDNLARVDVHHPTPASRVISTPAGLQNNGKALYLSNCSSCHGEDGEGVGNVFPALNKNDIVTSKKDILIAVILKGDDAIPGSYKSASGREMPSFDFLDDQQVARVLSYIRSSWDNKRDSIRVNEVKKIRKQLK